MDVNVIEMTSNVSELDLENRSLDEILDSSEIKADDVYQMPPRVIWVDDITVGTSGNFSASVGKAKSKKTFNMISMVASAITGEKVLHYRVSLPDGKTKVLYVDTEQSRYHCHKVVNRILRLAGLPESQPCDNLKFIGLREFPPSVRLRLIERALERCDEYGLVIIDGIRDLMLDINNATESVQVINKLMRWSSCYDLHIHCVLHLNKADDNIRGHIGTELTNKAETIMLISKSDTDSNISEVRPMHVRDQEFEPFAFGIDDSGLPTDVPNYSMQSEYVKIPRVIPRELSNEQHIEALSIAFKEPKIVGYENVIDALIVGYKAIGYSRARTTMTRLLTQLVNKHLLVKDKDQGYIFPKKEQGGDPSTPTTKKD
jgi:hypothetical protein